MMYNDVGKFARKKIGIPSGLSQLDSKKMNEELINKTVNDAAEKLLILKKLLNDKKDSEITSKK